VSLFRGLPPILLKEIPFVVTKFVTFDLISVAASALLADLQPDAPNWVTSSALPLASGALAGVFAALASQPADVVLTRTNKEGATLASSVAAVAQEPELLLQGLGPRLFFCVLLSSLQFLIYGQLRGLFGVSKDDLTLIWDALGSVRIS
jgi:solute carrier family 25 phosphate transporter 3